MPTYTADIDDTADLVKAARGGLPRDYASEAMPADELWAAAEVMAIVWSIRRSWAREARLGTSSGAFLDLHADNRGQRRGAGEGDATLIERLKSPPRAVTAPNINQEVAVLEGAAGATSGSTELYYIPKDGVSFLEDPDPQSFLDRGYRLAPQPPGRIAILQVQAVPGFAEAMRGMLSDRLTAGTLYHVEEIVP